jgi:HK97 family phage portal protein
MDIIEKLAIRLGYSKAKPAPPAPLLQATGAGQAYTIPDLSRTDAQEELFQRLSWVYGAVMAVATVSAGANLNVKKVSGEKRKDIPNHDLEMRLLHPNPLDSRTELLIKTYAYRKLTGNAYWWLNRRNENAPPAEIWALPPHQVTPIPDGRMFIKGYSYEPGQGEQAHVLQPWEVIHFKEFHPRNWFVGLSPIEALATVALGDLKAQEYNTKFFGANNAKVPGALAFADDVSDPAWDKLKKDIKEGWGGSNRSGAMLLRGVGQGGVQWVQMSLSQKDMEFLGSRTFTKEEIYSIFAPGLASVLAVNATEANARSGKATFIEMAVWPMLVSMAEKITNNLLPCYGPDLVADFDDLRVTDRMLAIAEQNAFGQVHTVNEIREKFYDAKKLKDERGDLLPAQIGPSTPGPEDEDAAVAPGAELAPMPPLVPSDELPPMDEMEQDLEAAPIVDEATQALKEIAAWRRFALRHGVARAQEFGCEHVQADVAAVIKARLRAATNAEEAKAAFSGPFLKAVPDAEDRLLRQLKRVLGADLDTIIERLGDPPDLGRVAAFWPEHALALTAVIEPEMERVAHDSIQQIIDMGGAVDFGVAALQAATWASTYTGALVAGIVDTSRTVVGDKVALVAAGTLALGGLLLALKPFFGEQRAGVIAATEVTRATTTGKRLAVDLARQAGQHMEGVWGTKNDELVCDICGPLNGTTLAANDPEPPAHPWCRCSVTYRWVR